MGRTREGIVLGSAVVAVLVTVIASPVVVGAVGLATGIASVWPFPLVAALGLIAIGFLVAYLSERPRLGVSVALWACAGIPLIAAAAWLYHFAAHIP